LWANHVSLKSRDSKTDRKEMETDLNQLFKTVDQLSPGELNLLRQRIDQSQRKKVASTSRGYPGEAAELFAIPFDKYLEMTEDERAEIAFQAYKTLDRWIEEELKARHSKWMLVCGGEILESSPKLLGYPSADRIMAIGKQRGLIPFVFIRTPLIEESSWSAITDSDYYPNSPCRIGWRKENHENNRQKSASPKIEKTEMILIEANGE
jgi:hypothetical protein